MCTSNFDMMKDSLLQLIILMALAKGKSRVLCGALSLHTETAMHVAQLVTKVSFIPVFDVFSLKWRCGGMLGIKTTSKIKKESLVHFSLFSLRQPLTVDFHLFAGQIQCERNQQMLTHYRM